MLAFAGKAGGSLDASRAARRADPPVNLLKI
jgi:hypothetical protein